jgi:hypothetical protein
LIEDKLESVRERGTRRRKSGASGYLLGEVAIG